jgi:hypothetical protein
MNRWVRKRSGRPDRDCTQSRRLGQFWVSGQKRRHRRGVSAGAVITYNQRRIWNGEGGSHQGNLVTGSRIVVRHSIASSNIAALILAPSLRSAGNQGFRCRNTDDWDSFWANDRTPNRIGTSSDIPTLSGTKESSFFRDDRARPFRSFTKPPGATDLHLQTAVSGFKVLNCRAVQTGRRIHFELPTESIRSNYTAVQKRRFALSNRAY